MSTHKDGVKKVSTQVKLLYKEGKKARIYHGSTNSTRKQVFKKGAVIDISNLNRVLKINQKEKFAIVEPNVAMDRLVTETLKFNLIPAVVMEFPGITVGGGIQGGAGESSSFKYGLFNECFIEYEIVLGDGRVISASPGKNADLFYGIVGTYGSLGIITQATLKLVPAKKYVTLTYYRVNSFEGALQTLNEMTKKKVDFIDGLVFSRDMGSIMVGKLSETPEHSVKKFSRSFDEWFYLHAEKLTKKHAIYQESIPLKDYLFRYDRGAFWGGKHGFNLFNVPFNRLFRFLLNSLLTTRVQYRFLQARNEAQDYFIQDVLMPEENTLQVLKYSQSRIGIYPLWLLPIKTAKKEKFSPAFMATKLVIDVGIWGEWTKRAGRFIQGNIDFEDFITRLGGRKMLYAHSYYAKSRFWKLYNLGWYSKLREKYKAKTTFEDLYEKTRNPSSAKIRKRKMLWDIIKSPTKLPVS